MLPVRCASPELPGLPVPTMFGVLTSDGSITGAVSERPRKLRDVGVGVGCVLWIVCAKSEFIAAYINSTF